MEVIIDQVSKSFRNGKKVLPVLEDINIILHKEEFVALVGPSGCGKSTLLNMRRPSVAGRGIRLFHRGRPEKRAPGIHRISGDRPHALAERV